jgi:hypothetical protein
MMAHPEADCMAVARCLIGVLTDWRKKLQF